MKIAVNKTTNQIVDVMPDKVKENSPFLINNDYALLEVENPYKEDGTFRDLTDEELSPLVMKTINEKYKEDLKNITEGIESQEIATWTKQEAEARAYLADNSSYTPLVDAIVEARGVTKTYLVNKIIEKADAYSVTIGAIMGKKQKLEKEI